MGILQGIGMMDAKSNPKSILKWLLFNYKGLWGIATLHSRYNLVIHILHVTFTIPSYCSFVIDYNPTQHITFNLFSLFSVLCLLFICDRLRLVIVYRSLKILFNKIFQKFKIIFLLKIQKYIFFLLKILKNPNICSITKIFETKN